MGTLFKAKEKLSAAKLNRALVECAIIPDPKYFLYSQNPGQPQRISMRPGTVNNRSAVAYGTSASGLPGTFPLSALASDVNTTDSAATVLVSVAANAVAFRFPGQYLVTYHGTVEIDVGGATSHTAASVRTTAELRGGGTTVPGSGSSFSALKIPNLSGFLKLDDGETAPLTQVDLGGATGKTAAFVTESFAKCSGSGCDFGLTATTLDPSDQQAVTLDTQTIDATDNFNDIASYTPAGTVEGTLSGTGLVEVVLESSVLKIKIGGTTYTNSLTVQGGVTGGDADALTCAVSILKIS